MTTSTARRVEKRDGYMEAIVAMGRLRTAHEQILAAEAAFDEALSALCDAAAATGGLQTWEDVLATPYGDPAMPFAYALAFGRSASSLLEVGLRDVSAETAQEEIDELEELIRTAIRESGPADWYQAKLDALWNGGDDDR